MEPQDATVVSATRAWLERAVIGLNLCPFAKAVLAKGQVHFAVSAADTADAVLHDLETELDVLVHRDPSECETTLLIVPHCLGEFLEYNAQVARCDRLIRKKGLEGVVQLATFHPGYCFADAQPQDMANFSNRSPYPIFQLLREASVEQAVNAFPDPESIYRANMERLRVLGPAGWAALGVGPA